MSRRIAALKPLRSPAGGVLFIRCSVVPEEKMPEMLVAPPAVERSGAWFHHGYESTHPPEPLLNALLHSDCTAKVPVEQRDRKSTRLNSSHGYISYAVFCLKKKKTSN